MRKTESKSYEKTELKIREDSLKWSP